MSLDLAVRFTDRHVRRYPELIALAIQYARRYDGEFDPLLDARDLVLSTGTLPVAIARKVLNCMRQDAEYACRLSEWLQELIEEAEAEERPLPFPPRRLRVMPEPEPVQELRSVFVRTGAAIREGMVIVPRRGGPNRRIHDPEGAYCEWQLYELWSGRWLDSPVPTLCVRPKHAAPYDLYTDPIVLGPSGAEAMGLEYCKRCFPKEGGSD